MIHIKSFEEIPTRGVALLDLQNHHCRFPLKDEPELIVAPLREHSRKPDEYHELCEAYSEGPHAELFSRCDRPGWQAWGNETGKFNAGASDGDMT